MNKSELALALAKEMHLGDDNQAIVTGLYILNCLFGKGGIIGRELAKGGTVTITGFGTFGTHDYSERVMQSPRGGEPVDVPSGRRPTFRAGAKLRRQVQREVRIWPAHR